jgi:hypothetical protein
MHHYVSVVLKIRTTWLTVRYATTVLFLWERGTTKSTIQEKNGNVGTLCPPTSQREKYICICTIVQEESRDVQNVPYGEEPYKIYVRQLYDVQSLERKERTVCNPNTPAAPYIQAKYVTKCDEV